MKDKFENLRALIERVENLDYAFKLPLSASTHVEQFRISLPVIVQELKKEFVKLTGKDPWN